MTLFGPRVLLTGETCAIRTYLALNTVTWNWHLHTDHTVDRPSLLLLNQLKVNKTGSLVISIMFLGKNKDNLQHRVDNDIQSCR